MFSPLINADYYPVTFTINKGVNGEILEDFPDWGNMIVGADIDADDLIFTIDMAKPDPGSSNDVLWLFLDYNADGVTDALIMWNFEGQDAWRYASYETGSDPIQLPVWIQASRNEDVFEIKIRRNGNSSPFTVPVYRFYVFTTNEIESDIVFITFPDIQNTNPFEDSSLFEEGLLPVSQVIPELPLGTITAVMTMILAFIYTNKRT